MPAKKTTKKEKKIVTEIPQSEKDVFLTQEGLKALVDELKELQSVRRKEIAEKIKDAIALGDLSENAEYEDAKNEQAFIEGRILELDILIKNAKIFKEKKGSKASTVQIGHTVELLNKDTKETEKYMIVGSIETDPLNNKISNESPVGLAVLGSSVGDKIVIKVPGGTVTYTLKKVY